MRTTTFANLQLPPEQPPLTTAGDLLLSTVDTTTSPPNDVGLDVDARSQQQSDDEHEFVQPQQQDVVTKQLLSGNDNEPEVVQQQQKQHLSDDMSGSGIAFQVFYDTAQGGRDYMEDVVSVKIPSDADSAPQGFAFFAVFDGHGGAEAARFADKHLLDQITRRVEFSSEDDSDVVQAIKDGFVTTHQMMTKAVGTNIVIKYLDSCNLNLSCYCEVEQYVWSL